MTAAKQLSKCRTLNDFRQCLSVKEWNAFVDGVDQANIDFADFKPYNTKNSNTMYKEGYSFQWGECER